MDCSYVFPPELVNFLEEKVRSHGPGLAGACFGAGWCFWADAVLVNAMHGNKLGFLEYLPGIIATLAMLLMCVVRRSDLAAFDSFDSASYCRQRFWLFVAYVVSFGSIIGAVTLLLGHMSDDNGPSEPYEKWIGWAAVLQVTSILGSGLILFTSRGDGDGYDDGFYTAF